MVLRPATHASYDSILHNGLPMFVEFGNVWQHAQYD